MMRVMMIITLAGAALVAVTVNACRNATYGGGLESALRSANADSIVASIDRAAAAGDVDRMVEEILSSARLHPDSTFEPLLRALHRVCDRTVINTLSDRALKNTSVGGGRLVVLAVIYSPSGARECIETSPVELSARVVDLVAAELMDTARIESRRWQGHAGADRSLKRYSDLAHMAFRRLLPGAPSEADLQAEVHPTRGSRGGVELLAAWWNASRDRAIWNEDLDVFVVRQP